MTIVKMYHVNCDGFTTPNDGVDCPGWGFESDTRTDVTAALRQSKWKTVGKRHYCPNHARLNGGNDATP